MSTARRVKKLNYVLLEDVRDLATSSYEDHYAREQYATMASIGCVWSRLAENS